MIVVAPALVLAYCAYRALKIALRGPKQRTTAKIRGCAASSSTITLLSRQDTFDVTLDYAYTVNDVTHRGIRVLTRVGTKNRQSARELVKFLMKKGQIPVYFRTNQPDASWVEPHDMQQLVDEYCQLFSARRGASLLDSWAANSGHPAIHSV